MEQPRTLSQNNAMHLWFEHLATELNDAGLDQRKVLKPSIDIPWSAIAVKEQLWRPIQEALVHKVSTTELTKQEVTRVFEILNRHLGEKFGLHVEWPHDPDKENKLMKALEMAKEVSYPEYVEPVL